MVFERECSDGIPPVPMMIFLFPVRPLVLPMPVSLCTEGVLDGVTGSVSVSQSSSQ